MSKERINRFGYITALLTFLIGTYFLLGDYFGWKGNHVGDGMLFLVIAFIINIIILIAIVIISGVKKITDAYKGIYFMLINIPVAIIYVLIGLYLQGFYRVSVVNDTISRITEIELSGCDNYKLSSLEPGESEAIWIEIKGDCSLSIYYIDQKKKPHRGVVSSYLCSGMGGAETYNISGKGNLEY